MIPRTLVPEGARLPAEAVASTRRRPTTLDERTLVPSGMPLVHLDGRTTIPSNLPLDSIAARVVVPGDVNVEAVQREEQSHLPPQPTEMDERISIPVGAAAPEEFAPLGPISEDLVEPDIFQSGEAAFLPPEWRGQPTTPDPPPPHASPGPRTPPWPFPGLFPPTFLPPTPHPHQGATRRPPTD